MMISFKLNYYNTTLPKKLVEKMIWNLRFSKISEKIHNTEPATIRFGQPWQVMHENRHYVKGNRRIDQLLQIINSFNKSGQCNHIHVIRQHYKSTLYE